MKEEFITLPLIKNEEAKRFELSVDGHIAFIDYDIQTLLHCFDDLLLLRLEVLDICNPCG